MANITLQANRWNITGDVLINNVNSLLNQADAFVMEKSTIVDFSGVTDVDTSAISLMLEWQRRAAALNCRIKFIHLPVNLSSLTNLYGVNDFICTDAVE